LSPVSDKLLGWVDKLLWNQLLAAVASERRADGVV